jgi:hypothetical protein
VTGIPNDPRLADVAFLAVAARRAAARRRAGRDPAPAWLEGEGLASLLKAVAPAWGATDREPPGRTATPALQRLLDEARRYRQEEDYGAV